MFAEFDLSDQSVAALVAAIFQDGSSHSRTTSAGVVQQMSGKPEAEALRIYKLDYNTPCYAALKPDAVRHMDDELKVAAAATARAVSRATPEQDAWSDIMGEMSVSPLLEHCPESDFDRSDIYKCTSADWKKSTPEYYAVVQKVRALLAKLMFYPGVDLVLVSEIAAHTGNTISGWRVYKQDLREHKILDITVLRYPDSESPRIKVYHIQFIAWYDSGTSGKDYGGIRGNMSVRSFMPRSYIIEFLRAESMRTSISEAESLYLGSHILYAPDRELGHASHGRSR